MIWGLKVPHPNWEGPEGKPPAGLIVALAPAWEAVTIGGLLAPHLVGSPGVTGSEQFPRTHSQVLGV